MIPMAFTENKKDIIQTCSSTYHIVYLPTTLNICYWLKTQKDKTQVKQLRQSSPIPYITKYTIEHYNIELHTNV
jgi:hypothetical protein